MRLPVSACAGEEDGGWRLLWERDGRILLRESGTTEPVIRVMVEAQSDELCAKYVDEMVQVIREEGLAVE